MSSDLTVMITFLTALAGRHTGTAFDWQKYVMYENILAHTFPSVKEKVSEQTRFALRALHLEMHAPKK
ncbi:hypothetical protein [Noviherbaspirillum sp. ST9]|uniref:hypothetical protein n=1 Tax=Noviherbaspirillum sp. ST9 TaxID=3401606 RepID=UPI003B5860D7